MMKLKNIIGIIVLLIFVNVAYAQINDGNFYITCDKEEYKMIEGYEYAYCNITKVNDTVLSEIAVIDFVFENNTYISANDIYYYNSSSWIVFNQTLNESINVYDNRGHGLRIQDNLTYNSTEQYMIEIYNTQSFTTDKFWIVLNSSYTGLTELDPEVSGCNSTSTSIICRDGSFTGTSIQAGNKTILIQNATINGNGNPGELTLNSTNFITIQSAIITTSDSDSVCHNSNNYIYGNFYINSTSWTGHAGSSQYVPVTCYGANVIFDILGNGTIKDSTFTFSSGFGYAICSTTGWFEYPGSITKTFDGNISYENVKFTETTKDAGGTTNPTGHKGGDYSWIHKNNNLNFASQNITAVITTGRGSDAQWGDWGGGDVFINFSSNSNQFYNAFNFDITLGGSVAGCYSWGGSKGYFSLAYTQFYYTANQVKFNQTSIKSNDYGGGNLAVFDITKFDLFSNFNLSIPGNVAGYHQILLNRTSIPKLYWDGTSSGIDTVTHVFCNNTNITISNLTALPSNLNITSSCGTPQYVNYAQYFDENETPTITRLAVNSTTTNINEVVRIELNVTDNADNINDTITYCNITLTSPNSTIYYNQNASTTNGLFWYSSSITLNQHGRWNISAICSDTGNLTDTETSYFYSNDTTPPTISLTAPTGTYNTKTNIPLTYNVTDNLALGTCIYNVYTAALVLEIANTSVGCSLGSDTFTVGSDGSYILNFYATDNVGNSNSTSTTFDVDTTAPPIIISGGGGGSGTTIIQNITFGAGGGEFLIEPKILSKNMYIGFSDTIEFKITNDYPQDIVIDIIPDYKNSDKTAVNWTTFENKERELRDLEITKAVGLAANYGYIRLNIKVPSDAKVGTYHLYYTIKDNFNAEKTFELDIVVKENPLYEMLGKEIYCFGEGECEGGFSVESKCEMPKEVVTLSCIKVWHVLVSLTGLIILALSLGLFTKFKR